MSEQRPWWLSEPPASAGWTGVLAQAQRMIGWATTYATEQILAPHSTHTQPEDHPDCALCQATSLLAPATPVVREEIAWITGRWTT
ncbi:MAG: hypothetical protein ACKOBJ_03720 [Actinomycetota bacterium]